MADTDTDTGMDGAAALEWLLTVGGTTPSPDGDDGDSRDLARWASRWEDEA